jgi:hypothetical protein
MRARGVRVLVVVACLIGTACSDDDVAPDREGASTSTTATTAPTTATSRAAAERSVVVSREGVLGSWEGGGWVQATSDQPSPLRTGDDIALVRLQGPLSLATAGDEPVPNEFCGVPQVDFDPDLPDPQGGVEELGPIGVHGVPDPQPRPVEVLDPSAAVYRDAAAEVLGDGGIEEPDPKVVQVVRADLSGDGTDEVLVVAERLADPATAIGAPGDYSILFLRQVVDGQVRTTVVEDFYKDPLDPDEQTSPYILVYRVSAVADLNGDGILEVVVEEQYYEGGATVVRALQPDGTLGEVLAAGCGV